MNFDPDLRISVLREEITNVISETNTHNPVWLDDKLTPEFLEWWILRIGDSPEC